MFKLIFKVLKKFFLPVLKFFSKKFTFIVAPLIAFVDFIMGILTGGAKALYVVWKYTAALFFVQLIRRFILFPIFAFIFYVILSYLWSDLSFSFLGDVTVKAYITEYINGNDFLSQASVMGYQFGIWQALAIFFQFVILTFIIRLFIHVFMKD